MAFSYAFTLFMFFGGIFGGGNDLLDYVPADAYWKLKATPLKFETMADEARLADPEAAVNLAKVFATSTGEDRDRLALALIDQGESARAELNRLAGADDADLAARARACLTAIDKAPRERAIRRLMAIRTLGGLGRKEAIPLLQPLLKSKEPFVAAYATEAIAYLNFNPPPTRPFPAGLKDDIWRLPADCRVVAQIAPTVAAPELADRVLGAMRLPEGMDRTQGIDELTFTLVEIADRFGDMRFDGITLAGSGDLSEKGGYVLAILRGYYDHATVNRLLADGKTPFNEFAGGRVYVPGGMAIYAPADDLLIFAASPGGVPPVQPVITAAAELPTTRPATTRPADTGDEASPSTAPAASERSVPENPGRRSAVSAAGALTGGGNPRDQPGLRRDSAGEGTGGTSERHPGFSGTPSAPDANPRLKDSPELVKLIASLDTTQPFWLAAKNGPAWRGVPGIAAVEALTATGRPTRATPLELRLEMKLTDAAAARDALAAINALLPPKPPAASTQAAGPEGPAPSMPLLATISAAFACKAIDTDGDRLAATATLTLTRADVMRFLLTGMDPRRLHKETN